MKAMVVAVLVAALAGCFPGATRESPRFFVLEPAGAPPAAKKTREGTLLVAPTTASSFYAVPQIAYSREPGSRAYYQLNRWTEPPARRIEELLIRRLEKSGAFQNVARATSGLRGGLVLGTHLEEMYHQAAAPPGRVTVTLTATLTDPVRRALIAQRTFTQTAPAPSYDAAGAVAGFNEAVGALLNDVVAWVHATAP